MPLIRKCKRCKKEFKTKPFFVKLGKGNYCSNACSFASRKKGKEIACHICGIKTYKKLKQINGSKSGLFFCSKSCQTKWRNQVFIGEKHANWKDGLYAYRSVLDRNKIPKVCTVCKSHDQRVLAVHHVDKNRKNNTVLNLAWLCHNCHFLVHHDRKEALRFMDALRGEQ